MKIDARGMACPQPVILTKKELEKIEEGVITVIVDNKASCSNVKNFAEMKGCNVTVTNEEGVFTLEIAKGYTCDVPIEEIVKTKPNKKVVVHFSGELMGVEDEVLGRKLMNGFIGNLKNMDILPTTIIFVNTSVRNVTVNEDIIPVVRELEELGIEILACGACLEHFGLVDSLEVGQISDAHKVMTRMFEADKLIRI